MSDLPEVGPWARDKLDALARYLDFYTKVQKNHHWRTIYLDAYAGCGRAVIRAEERAASEGPGLFDQELPINVAARELIDGSPRVALGIANPFDREPPRQRSEFGHVSTPRPIRTARGAPLYYLLWAGPNKKGLEGAGYILTMGERLSPQQGKRAAT
jgi:hypothetical protein